MPVLFHPFDFQEKLLQIIQAQKISKISLVGFSLGGFIAADFAAKYPDLVDDVCLVGIRKQYPRKNLDMVAGLLRKNKTIFLHGFYRQCFYEKKAWEWFKQNLLKDYCQNFDEEYLLQGLLCLEQAYIDVEKLQIVKNVRILHGQHDKIAPLSEAREIAGQLPQSTFVRFETAGHFIPLEKPDALMG